jgi:DNA-binding GntR family transcriptional regulator
MPVHRQLSEEAAAHVRDQIRSGRLAGGDRVRPEVIAEELQISPTPAREALQSLRSEGFLELNPRRGFRVKRMDPDDIRDLFLVTSFAAGELAARATAHASDELIERMRSIHEELTEAAARGDGAAIESLNHRFHRELNLAAESRKIADIIQLAMRWVPPQFFSSIAGWSSTTVHDHQELLDAVESRDSERARKLMVAHMQRAGDQLAQYVEGRSPEPARPKVG